jgi:hydroxyacylglutathione hydrolase
VGLGRAGPLRTHVTVVGCPSRREAAVIDSSGGADSVVKWAAAKRLTVSKLLQTHEHFDHTLGLEAMQNATHAPIYLHPDGLAGYNQLPAHASKYGVHAHDPPAPAHWLKVRGV